MKSFIVQDVEYIIVENPSLNPKEFVIVYENYALNCEGKLYSFKSSKFVSCFYTSSNYLAFTFHCNGRMFSKPIHKLLASIYLPNPNNYMYVNILDGNKENLHPDNLAWSPTKKFAVRSKERYARG